MCSEHGRTACGRHCTSTQPCCCHRGACCATCSPLPLALHDLQSNWLVSSQVYPGGGTLSPTTTQVYAPTIPGFGRSEKPALPYTQGLWQAFLRDFVVEVVRRPVVVAGNSIGGYLSACLAGGSPPPRQRCARSLPPLACI